MQLGINSGERINRILGTGTPPTRMPGKYEPGIKEAIARLQAVIDKIPEIKRVHGTVVVALQGQKPKTLNFKYG